MTNLMGVMPVYEPQCLTLENLNYTTNSGSISTQWYSAWNLANTPATTNYTLLNYQPSYQFQPITYASRFDWYGFNRRAEQFRQEYPTHHRHALSEDMRVAAQRRRMEHRVEVRASADREANAFERAMALFREHLDPAQLESFERDGVVLVRSERGRSFRIHCRGMMEGDHVGMGNIDWLDDNGQLRGRLCAHPRDVPAPDAWLAQMLTLQADEDALLRVANLHRGERPALAAA